MPTFSFNFDDIPDSVPGEGEIEAVIDNIELKYGKDSGKPYLNWTFTIVEGDHEKSKLWMITSLADTALFRLKQIAEQLGFEGLFELEIDENTNMVTYPPLDGTAVTLDIHHEEYQGRKTAKVSNIVDYHTTHHLPDGDADEFEDLEEDEVDEGFAELEEEEAEQEEQIVTPPMPSEPRKRTRRKKT